MMQNKLQLERLESGLVKEELTELRLRTERQKISLSKEVEDYVRGNLRKIQDLLLANGPIYRSDLNFIEKLKLWMRMPGDWRDKHPEIEAVEIAAEVKEISSQLKKDYQHSIEALTFFDLIETEEPEDMPIDRQEYFYKADFQEFAGKEIVMPSFFEILIRLTPLEVLLYQEMKEQGLEPKLQLVPIAMQIPTLGRKIDAKKQELPINTRGISIWNGIKDAELIYEADRFEISENGKKLHAVGGKSKKEWIEENGGWIVEIVSTRQILKDDDDKTTDRDGNVLKASSKIDLYLKENSQKGYRGLSYESYLIAQMEAMEDSKFLDVGSVTVLSESALIDPALISTGSASMVAPSLSLFRRKVALRDESLRFRRSIRVKMF